MLDKPRACWYRTRGPARTGGIFSRPKGGKFHTWSMLHVEFESGPGHYPVAIVEDEQTGMVCEVLAEDVCFGTVPTFLHQ